MTIMDQIVQDYIHLMVGFPETSFLSLSYLLYDDHTLFPKVFWILPLVFCVLETCPAAFSRRLSGNGPKVAKFLDR